MQKVVMTLVREVRLAQLLFLAAQFLIFPGADNLVAATGAELPVRPHLRATIFAFYYYCYNWHLKPLTFFLTELPS